MESGACSLGAKRTVEVPFSSFSNQKAAIDGNFMIFKYLGSSNSMDDFIESIILFITKFKQENILMLIIFSNWFNHPDEIEENDLIQKTYKKKKLTREHILGMRNVFDVFGIHYFVLNYGFQSSFFSSILSSLDVVDFCVCNKKDCINTSSVIVTDMKIKEDKVKVIFSHKKVNFDHSMVKVCSRMLKSDKATSKEEIILFVENLEFKGYWRPEYRDWILSSF
jgi:hypothetical protein